jgi:hypothetical protein
MVVEANLPTASAPVPVEDESILREPSAVLLVMVPVVYLRLDSVKKREN